MLAGFMEPYQKEIINYYIIVLVGLLSGKTIKSALPGKRFIHQLG